MFVLQRFFLFAVASIGFWLAASLFSKRRRGVPVRCFFHSDCRDVLESQFSLFFGVHVDVLGMMFYGVTCLLLAGQFLTADLNTIPIFFIQLLLLTGAFFFSLYLTYVHLFSLEQWCLWCLSSTTLCAVLFFCFPSVLPIPLTDLLGQHLPALLTLRTIAVALSVAGVVFTETIFFRFLRRFHMTPNDRSVLQLFSDILLLGLILFLVSMLWISLPEFLTLFHTSGFEMSLVVTFILLSSTLTLQLLIAPQLTGTAFRTQGSPKKHELHYLRHLSYGLATIANVSWCTIFLLLYTNTLSLSFVSMLMLYAIILVGAVIVSQLVERTTAPHGSLY